MAIYLLYGEETYLLETKLKKIKKEFGELVTGINYIQIDQESSENLISDLETPAFGFPKKLVIAKNTGLFKKEKKSSSKTKTTKKSTNSSAKMKENEKDSNNTKERKGAEENLSLQEKIAKYIENNKKELDETVDLIFVEQEVEKNSLYEAIEKAGEVKEFALLKLPELVTNLKKLCSAYEVTIDDATSKYLVECCRY